MVKLLINFHPVAQSIYFIGSVRLFTGNFQPQAFAWTHFASWGTMFGQSGTLKWHKLKFYDVESCRGLRTRLSLATPFLFIKKKTLLPFPVFVNVASWAHSAATTTASLIVSFCLGRGGEKRERNQRPLTGFLCPCSSWSQELMRVSSWNFTVQSLPEANTAFSLSAHLIDLWLWFCELLSISRSQERVRESERKRESGRAKEFYSALLHEDRHHLQLQAVW